MIYINKIVESDRKIFDAVEPKPITDKKKFTHYIYGLLEKNRNLKI